MAILIVNLIYFLMIQCLKQAEWQEGFQTAKVLKQ